MPVFRPDLNSIPMYTPGRPIDDVSRELGITDIAKLASNECPEVPFPEVQEAIALAAGEVNRYPDTNGHDLTAALAEWLGVAPEDVWLGAGSSQILGCVALAVGGPGTSALYADPSFVMYPIITQVAGAESITVPVDDRWRLDLDEMLAGIRDDTTLVYVCNPNNPTGTHRSASDIEAFVDAAPDDVMIVVDEAYGEYATAPDFATAVPLALERENVLVSRTFSKVFGLAGLRIGYAVGQPATLAAVRRTQPPFSANVVAQAAALESLRHRDRLRDRVRRNDAERRQLSDGLSQRGITHAVSQTNFVLMRTEEDPAEVVDNLLREGVIVRRLGSDIRVTVGTADENTRFLKALDGLGSGA